MADDSFPKPFSIPKLILIPALVTLAVTILRLIGELSHGSRTWFTTDMGASIVGIVWLAPVFGAYFAIRLVRNGYAPQSFWRALAFAGLGVLILFARGIIAEGLGHLGLQPTFHQRLVFIWALLAVAAVATLPGWPALFKTQLAYAYGARVPVAIIMFFAIRGHWGTHYDAAPPDVPAGISLMAKYLWLGFFPQLIFWVGFTVVVGMVVGSLVAPLAKIRSGSPKAAV
ncbi:MAG: hypothetical protein ACM3NO_10320 [Deltaproteobacteria bacterium]